AGNKVVEPILGGELLDEVDDELNEFHGLPYRSELRHVRIHLTEPHARLPAPARRCKSSSASGVFSIPAAASRDVPRPGPREAGCAFPYFTTPKGVSRTTREMQPENRPKWPDDNNFPHFTPAAASVKCDIGRGPGHNMKDGSPRPSI